MERSPCHLRRWLLLALALLCAGENLRAAGRTRTPGDVPAWSGKFSATGETVAVSPLGENLWVTVIPSGKSVESMELFRGARSEKAEWSAFDPVSRVWIGRLKSAPETGGRDWAKREICEVGTSLRHATCEGNLLGWINQTGGKVLPFAVMKVGFSTKCPPPGTPLVDGDGRVMGLYFQDGSLPNQGYALPAAAVWRVKQDLLVTGKLRKAWLGLSLNPENGIPRVTRVEEGSPAEKAGLKAGDLLLSVDERSLTDYADAANAFFYLIPGSPVKIGFQRGSQEWKVKMVPEER
ncbi:MAG: PDZ domain-containing protein [Luteolibacter sp.]